ncbi:MAG: GIY-YIG nuclease family protein [Propionibacteriaceae bacterium]|nr:GIY-YIG nuclease family protein [Propionibacteriaceae bacterium]
MGFTYILKCSDGKLYTGSTADIIHRFRQHSRGESKFTRRRLPVQLAWAQEFDSLEEAYIVEHQIKGWNRSKKIALIEGRLDQLPELARRGTQVDPAAFTQATLQHIAGQSEQLAAGSLPCPSPRLETQPVDALAAQGRRPWIPRAAKSTWL